MVTEAGSDNPNDPNRVFLTQPVKKTMQERALDMLFEKGFSTLVLVIVIYFLYTNLTGSIPVHIKAINDATGEISKLDREARAEDVGRHLEAVRIVVEGQKDERAKARDSAEQLERILLNKLNVMVRKVDDNVKKLEQGGIP